MTELEKNAMEKDRLLKELDMWDEMSRDRSRDRDFRMVCELHVKHAMDEIVGFKDVEIIGEKRGEARGGAKRNAEIIRIMLMKGLTVSQIAHFTGLTAEEVQAIKLYR